MIVVASATSNTGSAVAEALLAAGHRIRVLGRDRGRLQRFAERGAEAPKYAPTTPTASGRPSPMPARRSS